MIKDRDSIVVLILALVAASTVINPDSSVAQTTPARAASNEVDSLLIPQPDLGGVDPPVQEQIHAAQATLAAALAAADASRADRAEAFGNLGKIYQAYGFENDALDCYTNASRLDPESFRWSYYAGYLGQKCGDEEKAERAYRHCLTLKPDNRAVLLRFGELELALDHPIAAKRYFTRAAALRISSPPALTGLGKVALIEHQYDAAVKLFTRALASEPQASSIHYQLAMAYRGLGDLTHMREQLQMRGNVEPTIQDPLLDEIDVLKQGKHGLFERASAAMHANRIVEAVAICREMVRLDPSDPIAYKYLGIALARSGKSDEALKQYSHALELDPRNASVYSDIGALLIEARREDQAIAQFQQALKLDPGLIIAHFHLANLLMRRGQDADAEREYGIVVSLQPQNQFARLMQAMASVHSGSYVRARTLLEEAAEAFPNDPEITNALARLLAAAPDPVVRDNNRAMRMLEFSEKNEKGDPLEHGITLAMALAGVGRYREAAAHQQAIIEQLEASRQYDLARRLRADLARYRQGKPSSMPWASDDPIFTPIPSKVETAMEPKRMATH